MPCTLGAFGSGNRRSVALLFAVHGKDHSAYVADITMTVSLRKGCLLVAAATMMDDNFQQTVVLLCDHREDGSHGLVLNRPVEASPQAAEQLPYLDGRLYYGGPVQPQALQVLHPYGQRIPGAVEVLPGVFSGGDFDAMEGAFSNHLLDPASCLFFAGYSGWSEGQLEEEIESGAWLIVPGTRELVFDVDREALWTETVRLHGRDDPMFSYFPEDPRWN